MKAKYLTYSPFSEERCEVKLAYDPTTITKENSYLVLCFRREDNRTGIQFEVRKEDASEFLVHALWLAKEHNIAIPVSESDAAFDAAKTELDDALINVARAAAEVAGTVERESGLRGEVGNTACIVDQETMNDLKSAIKVWNEATQAFMRKIG